MSKDPKNIKEIDDYLSGELTGENRNKFEKRLEEDSELQEDFNATKQVIEGIEGFALKKMLKNIRKKLFAK